MMEDKFSYADDDVLIVSPCITCKHKRPGGATCAAFPDGIPDEVLLAENMHTAPIAGDHGVQYEKVEE